MAIKRVADVIADILAESQIKQVFMVTGGGAMHLNDALEGHPKLLYIACHHKQSSTMAAHAYQR